MCSTLMDIDVEQPIKLAPRRVGNIEGHLAERKPVQDNDGDDLLLH